MRTRSPLPRQAHASRPAAAAPLPSPGTDLGPTPSRLPGRRLVVERVGTVNLGGGTTPYVPLSTGVVLAFTDTDPDSGPSPAGRYRVTAPGLAPVTGTLRRRGPDAFDLALPTDGVREGTEHALTLEATDEQGAVLASSAPVTWAHRVVGHPRGMSTSSQQLRGRATYRAGSVARFRFDGGAWEPGTRFTTQVWVSRTEHFTAEDWTRNARGRAALVSTADASRPVMSVRVPRRVVGQHLWVSILGWKDGTAGWRFTAPAAQVVRR